MELHAYTRTVSDLFSVKRKYVVPRFQREYSWTKEQVKELWDDVVGNIRIEKDAFLHEEYFIGALVLVGDDKSLILQVVDGQQRLTTITIFLSALCHRFMEAGKENLASSIYENYIAGKDDEGKEYFKLENETPKPFFQNNIQHIKRDPARPDTDEEKALLYAYNELYSLISRENLSALFGLPKGIDNEKYADLLKAIREQLVKYLKVIFITVSEEEEAYTIFETLNARGMNLSFVDLIKNKLFKELNGTHPDDTAKTLWKGIRQEISSRDGVGSLEAFVRHWWISKYSYASADNVYKSFKKLYKEGKIDPKLFIKDLHHDAKLYVKISSPSTEDFTLQEERRIYRSLAAFRIFGLSQPKPFLLSLFRARENGVVKFSQLVETLSFLEKFHFMFNAVCSLRPSGVEASYSRAARDLRAASDKNSAKDAIFALREGLEKRVPEESAFIEKFHELKFNNGYTKDKRLIQYIFQGIEKYKLETEEFYPENISLEHILSQSQGAKDVVSLIGNLLPLGQALNGKAGNKSVAEKLKVYEQSKYALPREFAEQYIGSWSEKDIQERTRRLAEYCYRDVWKIF